MKHPDESCAGQGDTWRQVKKGQAENEDGDGQSGTLDMFGAWGYSLFSLFS